MTIPSIYVKFYANLFTLHLVLLSGKVKQLHDGKLGMQLRKRC